MRNYIALILFTSLSGCVGCGKPQVDASIEPYIVKFVEEGQNRGKSVDVTGVGAKFVDEDDGSVHGDCSTTPFSKTLEVSKKWWPRLNEVQKEMLIFHELGHCALGRRHIDITKAFDEKLKTLMIPGVDGMLGEGEYLRHRALYLDEMFSH